MAIRHLGGDDFDQILADLILSEIRAEYGLDLSNHPDHMQAIRLEAERAKIRLSEEAKTAVRSRPSGRQGTVLARIHTHQLEGLCAALVERTLGPCRLALKDSGLTSNDIDEVVLVGGSTRMPMVRQQVGDVLRKTAALRFKSGRSGRPRCRGAGRHFERRHDRYVTPGRDPAFIRHRNNGRGHEQPDQTEHYNPRKRQGNVHHLCGWPNRSGHSYSSGRARTGK